jgi:hypothetical protein
LESDKNDFRAYSTRLLNLEYDARCTLIGSALISGSTPLCGGHTPCRLAINIQAIRILAVADSLIKKLLNLRLRHGRAIVEESVTDDEARVKISSIDGSGRLRGIQNSDEASD